MDKIRVLVVDDDELFARIFQRGLDRSYYEIETVLSGEAAIARLQETHVPAPDIILLDQLMIGMTGFDAFVKIREMKIFIPVIMITGHSSVTLVTEFLKAGGDDFMEKPIAHFDILDIKIQKAIEKSKTLKALEQEKIKIAAMEEAFRLKSAFLANISHDIRSPISGVGAGIEYVLGRLNPEGNERVIDFLRKAKCGIDRVIGLLSDTLALSVLESGQFNYEFSNYDIKEVIDEVVESSELFLEEKGMAVKFENMSTDLALSFDRSSIHRVFSNIIGNAIKFSEKGEDIAISVFDDDRLVTVAIADRGVGIPDDEVRTIFNRFIRSKRTRRMKEGTGLGLAICHEIVSAHKGNIWAENNTDRGTTFYVQLPKNVENRTNGSWLIRLKPNPIRIKQIRILLFPLSPQGREGFL